MREQTDDKKGKHTEDTSRERRVEIQQRAAAQRGYPKDAEDPTVASPDYDIRQSGRVLELQNTDLWLRPTDMSWHLPVFMTIREEPFKNYHSRTSEKWKAKEDKIGEVKKQKIKRSDDEWNDADWEPSSWSWQPPTTWTSSSSSSWQQWRSDQTRERSDWQPSADWAARTKRVSVLIGDHRVSGSRHSHGSEETSSTRTFIRSFMTTKMTSGCDGLPSFCHFCHLSCFAVKDVRDCQSPLSTCPVILHS